MITCQGDWHRFWLPFLWYRRCSAMLSTAPTVEFMGWSEWRFSLRTPR